MSPTPTDSHLSSSSKKPHILLLGGHGAVALLLTPLLLSRAYDVTSVVRGEEQRGDVLALQGGLPGKVDVVVRSLEEVGGEGEARGVIGNAEWVVWCAGAGGKGGPERTFAIDRDACIHFIRAAAHTPSVKKFLLVSYLGSRRNKAPWWSDSDWTSVQEVNNGALKNYHIAKLAADESLVAAARERGSGFQAICLRPGSLTNEPATGKVSLGKTRARGTVMREDVAEVMVRCLENDSVKGWLDLLDGEEGIEEAVDRIGKEELDCMEGEDVRQ